MKNRFNSTLRRVFALRRQATDLPPASPAKRRAAGAPPSPSHHPAADSAAKRARKAAGGAAGSPVTSSRNSADTVGAADGWGSSESGDEAAATAALLPPAGLDSLVQASLEVERAESGDAGSDREGSVDEAVTEGAKKTSTDARKAAACTARTSRGGDQGDNLSLIHI